MQTQYRLTDTVTVECNADLSGDMILRQGSESVRVPCVELLTFIRLALTQAGAKPTRYEYRTLDIPLTDAGAPAVAAALNAAGADGWLLVQCLPFVAQPSPLLGGQPQPMLLGIFRREVQS